MPDDDSTSLTPLFWEKLTRYWDNLIAGIRRRPFFIMQPSSNDVKVARTILAISASKYP